MVGEEVGEIEEEKNTYEKFKVVLERNMKVEKLEQLFEDRQNGKNFKKVAYPFSFYRVNYFCFSCDIRKSK